MGEMKKLHEAWDNGEFTYPDEVQEKLGRAKKGQEIGNVMSGCTICPVGNGTCHNFIDAKLYKFHPDKGGKAESIMICSLGIKENGEECPLNK